MLGLEMLLERERSLDFSHAESTFLADTSFDFPFFTRVSLFLLKVKLQTKTREEEERGGHEKQAKDFHLEE